MNDMNITFKQATTADFPAIATLAEKIWKQHYSSIISMEQIGYMLKEMYSAESLEQQAKEGHVFILLYVDARFAGYAAVSNSHDKHYFLHKLYVDTDIQAKGVGTELLDHIIAERPGIQSLELTVNRQNYKAINFYFKNGFVIRSVADFDIGNNFFMNDFIMVRQFH